MAAKEPPADYDLTGREREATENPFRWPNSPPPSYGRSNMEYSKTSRPRFEDVGWQSSEKDNPPGHYQNARENDSRGAYDYPDTFGSASASEEDRDTLSRMPPHHHPYSPPSEPEEERDPKRGHQKRRPSNGRRPSDGERRPSNGRRPSDGMGTMQGTDGGMRRKLSSVDLTTAGASESYDLSLADNLDPEYILQTLRKRFYEGIIYTYIGEVLVSINPYQDLPIYDARHHARYRDVPSRHNDDPHIFFIADRAFQQMQDTQSNQVILVSGESGAGKTESTKLMIEHMTYISHSETGDVHERIVKANPVLEAFGNAQTVMNDNSSRFGKFVELSFSPDGIVVGAQVIDYLLEKCRVVHQGVGEKNFHIFYYFFAGMTEDKLKYYYLENIYEHRIMTGNNQKKDIFGDNKHYYARKYKELVATLQKLGFNDDDLSTIWICLAAILFVTNIEFVTSNEEDGSEVIMPEDPRIVDIVADLLKVDQKEFLEAILSNTTKITSASQAEELIQLRSQEQADDCRDAIAKALYSRLFGWIVMKINKNLQPSDVTSLAHSVTIGILDLSGFENFRMNSLEQFLINVANEHLQWHFNKHIFIDEQEQYEREGIDISYIEFPSNEEIINLFMGKPIGMFSLLDEESRFPQGCDSSLLVKWNDQFNKHPNYKPDIREDMQFTIKHYAGKVIYDATGFLEKNRDNFSENLKDCLLRSRNEFISDLFNASLSDVGGLSRTRSSIRGAQRQGPGGSRAQLQKGNNSAMRNTVRLLRQRSREGNPKSGPLVRNQPTTVSFFQVS
jgi:myosin heavy subunit